MILALAAAWAVLSLVLPDSGTTFPQALITRLDVAAATLAILAGLASVLRWRLDGLAASWWLAPALVLLGAPALASTPGNSDATTEAFAFACTATALTLITIALLGPAVDGRLRHPRYIAMFAGLGVVGALAAVVVESLLGETVGAIALAVWAEALAIVRWQRRDALDPQISWLEPTLVAFAAGLALPLFSPGIRSFADLAGPVFRLLAMSIAGVAALAALFETGSRHRRFALRWQIARDDADRHRQRIEADYSERLHEARSTVMAIEGGVRSMVPGVTEGEAHTHDLLRALTAEVGRLRGLLERREAVEAPKPFDVRDAIEPTLALYVAAGQEITADLPDRLTAIGRAEAVAQVTAGLLANAQKHAPGPVDVTAVRDGEFVAVRVADRGPGIPRVDRERIFELGERGESQAPGQGIGLHVARRLMRSMDGDLWAEPRVGGGAVFVMCFPAPPELTILPGGQPARRSRRTPRPDQAVER